MADKDARFEQLAIEIQDVATEQRDKMCTELSDKDTMLELMAREGQVYEEDIKNLRDVAVVKEWGGGAHRRLRQRGGRSSRHHGREGAAVPHVRRAGGALRH